MQKLTKVALAVVLCLAAGYSVYTAQKKDEPLSDVMLKNVEALAKDEINGNFSHVKCEIESTWDPVSRIYVEVTTKVCTGSGRIPCSC